MRIAVTKAAVLAMLAAATAGAATAMKNPLYGDPAHPNISGMWNPEYAYFGPPIGDAARPADVAPGAAPGRERGAAPGAAIGAPPGVSAAGQAAPSGAPGPGGGPPSGKPPAGFPAGMAFRPPMPQLTPAYAKKYAEWRTKFETGEQEPDSVTRCLAFGLARFGTMPVEIIQTPGQITMNLGVLHDIRRIFMDGIGHTTGADPS